MANETTNNTGYGYSINSLPWVAPQVFAISNGLAIAYGFIQSETGRVGAMSYLDEDDRFEWDDRILPTIADCEEELRSA